MEEATAGGGKGAIPEELVRLLKIPQERRKAEDIFEIANGLYRASFVRQLDIATRYGDCRTVVAYKYTCVYLVRTVGVLSPESFTTELV